MAYAYYDGKHVWGMGESPDEAFQEAQKWISDAFTSFGPVEVQEMKCFEATPALVDVVDWDGGCGDDANGNGTIFTILGDGRLGLTSEAETENANHIKKLKTALRATLDWIDTVPKDAQLPSMPGFDRDEIEALLK